MIFIAITVPWRLAFSEEDTKTWIVINGCVDFSFLVDIIFTFFTAFFSDQKMCMITNRKEIAKQHDKVSLN